MFLHRKRKLEVDFGELEDEERESLSSFLRSHLKVDVAASGSKVVIHSEKLSTQELKRLVNKFVYHRNLHHKYWVALKNGSVKINKFAGTKKQERRKREVTPPSTIKHGW